LNKKLEERGLVKVQIWQNGNDKITFMNKLRADSIQGMLATTQ